MQYGIEGFAPKRHLVRENGGKIKDGDALVFEVIEFSKENKSIVLSHTNSWKADDKAKAAEDQVVRDKANKSSKAPNKSNEKTSLGELDAFSDLKAMFDSAGVKEEKVKVVKKEKAVATEGKDDLKKITGIGPAFEKRLNALGLNSYEDLINLTDETIAELETKDSMTSLEQWHTWMEEAKALKA